MNLSTKQRLEAYRVLIGEMLMSERKKKRYSQQNVADITGLSRVSISHYERGVRSINIEDLYSLCQLCGFDYERIVSAPLTASVEELNSAYDKYIFEMQKNEK